MAAKTDEEPNACVIQWKIENISHCWLKRGGQITSPKFIADALEDTKWTLLFLPIGYRCQNNVEFYLYRDKDCTEPREMDVNLKLAFLNKDGSFLKEEISNHKFRSDCSQYCSGEERRKVFVTDRETFLPDDSLTVQCTIWKKDEPPVTPKELFARTVWKIKRRNFVWKIDKFSTLKAGVKNKFKDDLMDFNFVLKEGLDFEEKLVIDVNSCGTSTKYFWFKIAVINSEGKKEYYRSHEYFEDDLQKGISATLLSTSLLIKNKSRYLPNDILSLDFECLYSNGTIADEFCNYGINSPKIMKVNAEDLKEHFVEQPNIQLINDLKSMYNNGTFSDTELRTSTQNFPCHRNILSARSPVFRRMFSNDMKKNNTSHIDVTDLEDDTVHRMLLFIYTDSLEGLQLENACKLYVAADKYEITSLKSRCSSFLKENLCPNKACGILVLADQHQDDDLRSAVQDFILRHDEVFGLQEWKHFMTTNMQLAADIMHKKINPS